MEEGTRMGRVSQRGCSERGNGSGEWRNYRRERALGRWLPKSRFFSLIAKQNAVENRSKLGLTLATGLASSNRKSRHK